MTGLENDIKLLVKVQDLDVQIQNLDTEIKRIPKEMDAHYRSFKAKKDELAVLESEFVEIQKNRKLKEVELIYVKFFKRCINKFPCLFLCAFMGFAAKVKIFTVSFYPGANMFFRPAVHGRNIKVVYPSFKHHLYEGLSFFFRSLQQCKRTECNNTG